MGATTVTSLYYTVADARHRLEEPRMNDVDQARHSRLVRLDAKITRCPHCGAWTWLGTCTTPHLAHKETPA